MYVSVYVCVHLSTTDWKSYLSLDDPIIATRILTLLSFWFLNVKKKKEKKKKKKRKEKENIDKKKEEISDNSLIGTVKEIEDNVKCRIT